MLALLAGELQPPTRIGHHPRVHHIDRRTKDVRSFEKVGALLGKKEGELIVDLESSRVGFDLGEIGIEGAAKSEVGSHSPAHRQSRIGIVVAFFEGATHSPCRGCRNGRR